MNEPKLTRNMSTPESRRIWENVEKAAARYPRCETGAPGRCGCARCCARRWAKAWKTKLTECRAILAEVTGDLNGRIEWLESVLNERITEVDGLQARVAELEGETDEKDSLDLMIEDREAAGL